MLMVDMLAMVLKLALMVLRKAKAGSLSKTAALIVMTGILQVVMLLLVLLATAAARAATRQLARPSP